MKEKVYSVDNCWDMTILEGIADCNGKPYHYSNVFSESKDDWTDEYLLTPLPEDIFALGLEIWNYWLYWLETSNRTRVPHSLDYADQRKDRSFETLTETGINSKEWLKAEQNYQNQYIWNHYLKTNVPAIKVRGVFSGKIDGTETFVEWFEIKP